MINIGSKYYKYDQNPNNPSIELVRVLNYETQSSVRSTNGIYSTDKLSNEYIELIPDAKIDIMITEYDNGDPDIYLWLYRMDRIVADKRDADLVLRQDIYSSDQSRDGINRICVGDCLTSITYGKPLLSVADFKRVKQNLTFSVYLDDTQADILKIINSNKRFVNKLNKTFAKMSTRNSNVIFGYCDNIEQLMNNNQFMHHFRSLFNIHTVPIELNPSDENIILTDEQHKVIEDLLQYYITNVNIIRYDKDIDLAELIQNKTKHVLISDKLDNIYLIAYSDIGPYPIDDDIANAMGM